MEDLNLDEKVTAYLKKIKQSGESNQIKQLKAHPEEIASDVLEVDNA